MVRGMSAGDACTEVVGRSWGATIPRSAQARGSFSGIRQSYGLTNDVTSCA